MEDKLHDEAGRLAALGRLAILDTQPEAAFDKITSLVRSVLKTPIAAVTLIDKDRQWLKSRSGIETCETSRDASFCTHTIKARKPMVVSDAMIDARFVDNPLVTGDPFIRSYLGVPLSSPDGYNVGALCAIDTRPRKFEAAQVQIMESFAALVMDEMELRLIAQTDFLTGALTRRAFLAELERARTRLARQGEPAALLLIDLDHFKSINDRFGHAAGDAVLSAVALACSGTIRAGDAFGRLGGEEFAILLSNATLHSAAATAERLRRSIASLIIKDLANVTVTASFGVAPLALDQPSIHLWMERADAAMYQAKQDGRNRVCVAKSDLEPGANETNQKGKVA